MESLTKAQGLILAGKVVVADQCVDKPGKLVDTKVILRLRDISPQYVSRGGLKLEHALKEFQVDPSDKICLDAGVSTGGFTDCLLQHGAKKVYAVDVGYGQLAWKLRQDSRVIVIERQNIRYLSLEKIPEKVDLCVIDVSFISLKKIFPPLKIFLKKGAFVLALIKPQFEVDKSQVGEKGVVKDRELHSQIIEMVKQVGKKEGWQFFGVTKSPILGGEGNQEFLILFQS